MASTVIRQTVIQSARLVVVKLGTNVLTGADGQLDEKLIRRLARQIATHHSAGRRFVVVSSGAVGAGMAELGLTQRPKQMAELQAVAAVGQKQLMNLFHAAFSKHGLHAAQLLVTRADFENRTGYLNIRNTIQTLHRFNAIPVINENDSVSVAELRFGDNDTIAALTCNLLRADLLIILSVVDGLLDADGRRVDLVSDMSQVGKLVRQSRSALGSGGMKSKLAAIGRVVNAGEVAMIANGKSPEVICDILRGEQVGTVFVPAASKMSSRDRWIGMAARPVGAIRVDAGAVRAIIENHKSLLPGGVVEATGDFQRGDVIAVLGPDGREIARGLAQYAAEEVRRIMGCKTAQIAERLGIAAAGETGDWQEEIIHRDHLVVSRQCVP